MLGPIFNREFLTVPRRPRHYATRVAYLGALWVIAVTAWLATVGWTRSATLGEAARFGPLVFQVLTFVQLALFLFFAALSAASAVAHKARTPGKVTIWSPQGLRLLARPG